MSSQSTERKASAWKSGMWFILSVSAVVAAYFVARHYGDKNRFLAPEERKSIFEFQVDTIDGGHQTSLSQFQGKKAYLVVNVASNCGLTNKNYAELQELYEKYE